MYIVYEVTNRLFDGLGLYLFSPDRSLMDVNQLLK